VSSLRGAVADFVPPIVVRAAKRLLGRGEPAGPPAEVLMPSFSSEAVGSYSQYGEDLVIDAVLGCLESGFFVDVGANDPILFNNTKRFSERGWTGVNVEPNPELLARIAEDRPRDVNVNAGVGSQDCTMTFYSIDPDTLSTFDKSMADQNVRDYAEASIVATIDVQVMTLESLLTQHVPAGQRIDFLSLDVEGGELDALGSNNWRTCRPRCLMIEVNRSGQEIVDFLSGVGYANVWCNGTNALFLDSENAS
jgi:FkbM family methyltransferase